MIFSKIEIKDSLSKFADLGTKLFSVIPGTGPYILEDKNIKNQESYTFERRKDYWDINSPFNRYKFNFDKIKVSVVKDNDALQYEKFKKGEQDIYNVQRSRRWVEETDFTATERGWIKKQRVFSEKPAGTSGYYFNMREWPFNDKRVRYAFCYLYDREKMNREMYYNEYGMMNSLYSGSVYENKNKFSLNAMTKEFEKILDKYLPEFEQQVSLKLPKLQPKTSSNIKLPKLKKK